MARRDHAAIASLLGGWALSHTHFVIVHTHLCQKQHAVRHLHYAPESHRRSHSTKGGTCHWTLLNVCRACVLSHLRICPVLYAGIRLCSLLVPCVRRTYRK